MYELFSDEKKSITFSISSVLAIRGIGRLFIISLIFTFALAECELSISVSMAVMASVLHVIFKVENSLHLQV